MATPRERLHRHLHAHPQLYGSALAGLLAGCVAQGLGHPVTRALLGWNVAVWLFLALTLRVMLRADHAHMERAAKAREEGEGVILALVMAAVVASVAAIVVELASSKATHGAMDWGRLAFVGVTIAGSWLLLPVLFALNYAGRYYRAQPDGGLAFPGAGPDFHPDYLDFLYFSFTIGVAAQTADVAITSPQLRRLVLVQAVTSFAFNTAVLALTINTAAQFV